MPPVLLRTDALERSPRAALSYDTSGPARLPSSLRLVLALWLVVAEEPSDVSDSVT